MTLHKRDGEKSRYVKVRSMARYRLRYLLLLPLLVFGVAAPAFAQVSGIQGTVTDTSGAVLPGVVVRALHVDTGTTQESVANETGRYFFQGVRLGAYELSTELSGFSPVRRTGITVEVGQTVTINLQMALAALQESVTVTGAAPLIDVTESKVGGNLNVEQLDITPINGRQWTMMTNLAPGARGVAATAAWNIGNAPVFGAGTSVTRLNVDGASLNSGKNNTGGTLDYSQYTIQEIEVLSGRFGAQHGHSAGGVLNGVTRSGTNRFTGSAYGFFRHDALNAKDFFLNEVRPFKDYQFGALAGGPIRRDRTFYFVSWESERAPQTVPIKTGIPVLDAETYENNTVRDIAFFKLDHELAANQRVTGSLNLTDTVRFVTQDSAPHVSSTNAGPNIGRGGNGQHVWTVGNNKVNHIAGNFTYYNRPIVSTQYYRRGGRAPYEPDRKLWSGGADFPNLSFPAASLGSLSTAWGLGDQKDAQIRDDFSAILSGRTGEHSLHVGGEYLYQWIWGQFEASGFGRYRFNGNPSDWAAVKAVVEANDYVGLQRLVDTGVVPKPVQFFQSVGDSQHEFGIHTWSGYVQDDWRLGSRFTANLGLRYDVEVGALRGDFSQTRFLQRPDMLGRPNSDTDNWQPRFGFVWSLNDRGATVLRGGAGRYYDRSYSNELAQIIEQNDGDKFFGANVLYDGSPTFMSNPLGKFSPACDAQLLLKVGDSPDCINALIAAGLSTDLRAAVPWYEQNYTDQYAIGLQHQFTGTLALGVDVIRMDGKAESYSRNTNLWVDCGDGRIGTYPGTWPGPACTGRTLPVSIYGRPDPRFGDTGVQYSDGYSRYDAVQVDLTKRLSEGYQFKLSYVLSETKTSNGGAIENGLPISEQYGRSGGDEHHRLTGLASVMLPWETQVSGVVFFSGGNAYNVFQNRDLDGDLSFNDRTVAPDGSKVRINDGWTDPVFRVDLRIAKRVRVRERIAVEGMLELFNAFNRENYFSYVGNRRSPRFGQPTPTTNLLYQPRMGQLAIRVLW